MSLNKFTDFQTGIDIKLEIGAHILECDDLIVLNSITLPPNIFVDNLTVNDSLTIVCDDTSTYNLTTATNGNLGDILSTDGNGNTFWTAAPLPPLSGIVYSGILPADVGRILQISNPAATTCTRSSIIENLTDFTVEKPIQMTTHKITSTYVPLNNDDLVNKLYVDNVGIQGPTGPQGPQGIQGIQGIQGPQGSSSNLFLYLADTTTLSGYPTNQSLAWDNTTQISSTNIRVSHLDDNNVDIDVFLSLVQIGQQLLIQDRNVSSNFQTWLINGTPVNSNPATPTSYWTYPVSLVSSSGTGTTNFANNHQLFLAIISGDSLITLTTGGTDLGTNSLVASSSVNPSLKTKGVVAGTNVTITDSGTDLTINSSGGSYTFQNGGTGTTLVASTSTITDFKPVSLTAGSNVTIAGAGTDNLTISSAGALGTNTVNITSITVSASTYYPVFNSAVSGVTTTLSTDSGGLTYIPTQNLLTTGAMNSGIYTSTVAPPTIGFAGHASSAYKIQTTDGSAFTSSFFPLFSPLSTSATSQEVITDSGLSYIPSQNKLTTSLFNGTTFTSTTAIPGIGFVGASTSASQIQTTDGSAFTSPYFITFVPLSASAISQSNYTDSALSYIPSQNLLGLSATTNYTGILYTSSNVALTAGFVGTCSRSLEVSQTDVSASTTVHYLMMSNSSASSSALVPSKVLNVDSGLSYLPSTNALTATTFIGALTGNSSSTTNINGVATNQLLVQTATNTTAFLSQGVSGQFLRSNGASLPTWEASRGFQMSWGGNILVISDFLTPNKFADTNSLSVAASGYLTQWRCPIACSITGWSSTVETTGASQLSILINGVAGTAVLGIATATSQSGSITARTVNANDYIEVRITNTICNAVLITLYFS